MSKYSCLLLLIMYKRYEMCINDMIQIMSMLTTIILSNLRLSIFLGTE